MTPEQTERLAALLGPIHETTVYGRIYDVKAEAVAKLGAKTGMPHPDEIDLRNRGPLISLDEFGWPCGIRYFDRALASLDVPSHLVDVYLKDRVLPHPTDEGSGD